MKTISYSVVITVATEDDMMLPSIPHIENVLVDALSNREGKITPLVTAAFVTVEARTDLSGSAKHTAARTFYRSAIPTDFRPETFSGLLDRLWLKAADRIYQQSIEQAYGLNEGSDLD